MKNHQPFLVIICFKKIILEVLKQFLLIFILFYFTETLYAQLNDNCSGAVLLCSGNVVSGSNIGASVQTGGIEGDGDSTGTWGGCFNLQNTVWYNFNTNNSGGAASLDVSNILESGNSSKLQVAVYSSSNACTGSLSSVSCGTISGTGSLSLVGLQANSSYWILIDGFGNDTIYSQCTFNLSVSGPAIDPVIITNKTDATCGANNGTISIANIFGGSGNYTYSLNQNGTFQTAASFNNLTAGTYTVYIKDASGCTYASNPVNVMQLPKISGFTINTQNASCNANDGSVSVNNVVGGNAPYTFQITGQNSNNTGAFNNLGAGNYYMVVTDANGCDTVTSFFIEQTAGIETAIAVSTPSACNGATGTIDIVGVTGNATPQIYIFGIDTFNVLPITGVPSGNQVVTIIDNNGCKFVIYTAYVQEGTKPSASFTSTQEICGKKNGTISVFSTNGGVGPYTYSLNGSIATSDSNFINLSAGLYTLIIYDSFGCRDSISPLVPLLTGATLANSLVTDSDCKADNGSVQINNVIGGTPPYQYSIGSSVFQANGNFINLTPGNYPLIIKDDNNCIDTVSVFFVNEINQILNVNYQLTPIVCGTSFGSILADGINVNGGAGPYEFSLNGSAYLPIGNFTSLSVGQYLLTVRDANGCELETSILLQSANQLFCEAGPGATIVRGATVALQGDSDAPSINWTPNSFLNLSDVLNPNASPKLTTTYTINGSSNEGCTCKDTVLIEVIPFINPPNAFTPDGDNMNDVWDIPYLEFYPNCEVDVYNRWGQKIFSSNAYPVGSEWDGKYMGRDVPVATYYYVIRLNSGVETNTEEEELYKGSVTVIR